MLSKENVEELQSAINEGEKAKKILDEFYYLNEQMNKLFNTKKSNPKCNNIVFNNGYADILIPIHYDPHTAFELINKILDNEITIIQNKLKELKIPYEIEK